MSERLSRKEIKRDEFAEVMGSAMDYATGHLRTLFFAAGGVLVLALAGVGVFTWMQAQESRAVEALTVAIEVRRATIDPDNPSPDADDPTFASEEARRQRSRELFEAVRDDYGSTDAARVAAFYLASLFLEAGDAEQARAHWQEVLDEGEDDLMTGEALVNLVALDRSQGRGEEAVARLEGMLDAPEATLPEDLVLFHLGETYAEMGRDEEALDTFQRLVQSYPASPYTQSAQQQIVALGGGPSRSLPVG